MIKTEFMWKDEASGGGGCPSISRVIAGLEGYVVVGKNLTSDEAADIPQIAADETAVFVPANVLDRLKDHA